MGKKTMGTLDVRGALLSAMVALGVAIVISDPVCAQGYAQSPYAMDGLRLGDDITKSASHSDLSCNPSQIFRSFTWCTRQHEESAANGRYVSATAALHSADGRVFYMWKMINPAFFGPDDINKEIGRLSKGFMQLPKVLTMPPKAGLPSGVIVSWGDVLLQPLDAESIQVLAAGKTLGKGLMIDFLGNFGRSAQEGLPIYLISGGAGMLYGATYDESGRGNLRLAISDASQFAPSLIGAPASSVQPGALTATPLDLADKTSSGGAESAASDPILLSCTFDNGRIIGGIVLFKQLKKLRIWYGDGGGQEWNGINYFSDPISTSVRDKTSIVLSVDFKTVIFNRADEHAFGACKTASISKAPLWWFNPVLKQEWEYQTSSPVDQMQHPPPAELPGSVSGYTSEIPMQKTGGTFVIPVSINDALTLSFVIDSGAADVSIPADVFLTLFRTGTLTSDDFLGTQTYRLADGSTVPSATFRIRTLKVGDRELKDVMGSVTNVNGTLLLGQSFLSRFKSWSIDNERGLLLLN